MDIHNYIHSSMCTKIFCLFAVYLAVDVGTYFQNAMLSGGWDAAGKMSVSLVLWGGLPCCCLSALAEAYAA